MKIDVSKIGEVSNGREMNRRSRSNAFIKSKHSSEIHLVLEALASLGNKKNRNRAI